MSVASDRQRTKIFASAMRLGPVRSAASHSCPLTPTTTAPVSMPIAMATEPQVRAPVVLVFADPPSLSDNAVLSDKRVGRSCEDVAARCTPFAVLSDKQESEGQ